jgi:beta-catenin-like protein 1
MDSEVDLDEEIKKLHIIATSPALYKDLVELGSLGSLISLLSHENPDIAGDVIALLSDMVDVLHEAPEEAAVFVDYLIGHQALEALVQNLLRLDEDQDDETQVYPYSSRSLCTRLFIMCWQL